MNFRTLFLASILAGGVASVATAQQAQSPMPMAVELPEACRAAGPAGGGQMQGMQSRMFPPMQSGMQGMMGSMTDAQKGYHEAMMRMDAPMMAGMMAKDPDVAWACAMIPHHRGAIEMSRVVLRTGNNPEIKQMAEKVIVDQEREIAELTAWVQKNSPREK